MVDDALHRAHREGREEAHEGSAQRRGELRRNARPGRGGLHQGREALAEGEGRGRRAGRLFGAGGLRLSLGDAGRPELLHLQERAGGQARARRGRGPENLGGRREQSRARACRVHLARAAAHAGADFRPIRDGASPVEDRRADERVRGLEEADGAAVPRDGEGARRRRREEPRREPREHRGGRALLRPRGRDGGSAAGVRRPLVPGVDRYLSRAGGGGVPDHPLESAAPHRVRLRDGGHQQRRDCHLEHVVRAPCFPLLPGEREVP